MNKVKIFCYIITLFFVLNCTQNQDEKTIELGADSKKAMLSDSTFFGSVLEILHQENIIYMTDNSPRLFKFDQDFETVETIHSIGKGPKEFNWISDISYDSDSLYLYDHSLRKMIIYDNNLTFVREFTLKTAGNIFSFAVGNNHIFVSTPYAENPISMFDKNGKVVKTFGVQSADTASFNVYRNSRHLLISNDKLIVTSQSDPVIRIFNLRGELLNTKEIKHPLIADRVAYAQETYKKPSPNGGYPLIHLLRDAVINNGKLYLLAYTHTKEITDNFTLVLVYEITEGGNLNFLQTLKLYKKDRTSRLYGTSLTVIKGKIIVFDDALFLFKNESI